MNKIVGISGGKDSTAMAIVELIIKFMASGDTRQLENKDLIWE